MRDAVDAGAWVSALRDRVASYDGLYAFAAGVYSGDEPPAVAQLAAATLPNLRLRARKSRIASSRCSAP